MPATTTLRIVSRSFDVCTNSLWRVDRGVSLLLCYRLGLKRLDRVTKQYT